MMPDSQVIPTWLDYIYQTLDDLKTETDETRRESIINELQNMGVREDVIDATLQENEHHAENLS